MSNPLKRLLPRPLLARLRAAKHWLKNRHNASRSTEHVFSEIYARNVWGGESGEFYSGGGTGESQIADAYVEAIQALAAQLNFDQLRAVDLGCGDMRIGRRIAPAFRGYLGVDVVKPLIESHRKNFSAEGLEFRHLDIVEDPLPEGEVCLVRQVLQHLSNAQIEAILPKLRNYRYVIITEHLPTPIPEVRKNIDKVQGGSIRLYWNSGVFVLEPPFSFPAADVKVVLEIAGSRIEGLDDRGVIQTLLIRPPAKGN